MEEQFCICSKKILKGLKTMFSLEGQNEIDLKEEYGHLEGNIDKLMEGAQLNDLLSYGLKIEKKDRLEKFITSLENSGLILDGSGKTKLEGRAYIIFNTTFPENKYY